MERNGISKDGKYNINDIANKDKETGEWEFTPARKACGKEVKTCN